MKRNAYRYYLLIVLMVILAFNYMDRFALGIVLEDIKTDLVLTDAQLGLMSGIAFAFFYSIMGIPIARWADRGNRVRIIAVTAVLWSVMVALCGRAANFVQLLLIRVGVGVGEAGCVPPAHSLIADNFSRAERPRAQSIYMQGQNLSLLIGYFLAGWLNELYGWRTMFILLGLPGLALGALAWLTLREPRVAEGYPGQQGLTGGLPASSMDGRKLDQLDVNGESGMEVIETPTTQPSLKEVCITLWSNKTFRHLLCGFSIWYFFGYGIMQWQPAFFVRSFGLQTGALGTWFALVYGVCGLLGTHWGGEWASRYAANNERLQLRAMAIANVGFNSVIWALIYFSHSYYVAFAWMGLSTLGSSAINGPLFAAFQTLIPPQMRATSIALVYMFANLIGMGLGPLAVGMLSDVLAPITGHESLRYALLAASPGYVWVSWHLWKGSETVNRDLEALSAQGHIDATEGESCSKAAAKTCAV